MDNIHECEKQPFRNPEDMPDSSEHLQKEKDQRKARRTLRTIGRIMFRLGIGFLFETLIVMIFCLYCVTGGVMCPSGFGTGGIKISDKTGSSINNIIPEDDDKEIIKHKNKDSITSISTTSSTSTMEPSPSPTEVIPDDKEEGISITSTSSTTTTTEPSPSPTEVEGTTTTEDGSDEGRNISIQIGVMVIAKKNEFPFLADIRVGKNHRCGGAFVTPQYIVTAASCLVTHFAKEFVVNGGEHRIYQNDYTEQTRQGVDKIVHKGYKGRSNGFLNNIGLLKVDKPFELNEYVKLVKLPRGWWNEPTPTATVMGWGLTRYFGRAFNYLRKVELPHVDDYICSEQYKKQGGVTNTEICYGLDEGGKVACYGDSGGPLVCGSNRVLCGITSKDVGCATPGKPGIYTEVSRYVEWINKKIKENP